MIDFNSLKRYIDNNYCGLKRLAFTMLLDVRQTLLQKSGTDYDDTIYWIYHPFTGSVSLDMVAEAIGMRTRSLQNILVQVIRDTQYGAKQLA